MKVAFLANDENNPERVRHNLDERAFERLVQSVVDYAIFMLDIEGRVATWNAGAARIKGYAADDILGEHFSRFYTDEDRAAGAPWRALRSAAEHGQFLAEGWRLRKDGSRFWASVVIDPIHDDDGRLIGFAKVTRDLTERRAAEEELARSREQLFQAQKMEAVGQLTGGLAHDFNNLLTGITGSLDLLKRRMGQGRIADLDRYISTAQAAAARAASLTHRLLAFARRQTLDAKPVNANALVAGMEELIRRTMGPAVMVEAKLGKRLWSALCDPNQLESAILNLCINARDAMPTGGRVTIETTNTALDDQRGRAVDLAAGDYVAICVTDTGSGMTPDVVARAFDPFFTTKPIGSGTGLGLSMIYGFAKQSHGAVVIESQVGVGTTVKIYLPRHSGQASERRESTHGAAPLQAGGGETVLVVDDEPSVRMLVCETLEENGYRAIDAVDAASALRVLQSDARIDLLITDVGLPGLANGRQMADQARLTRPQLKVLFVTGYAETAAYGAGALPKGMDVLAKPFTMEAIAARVRTIISGA